MTRRKKGLSLTLVVNMVFATLFSSVLFTSTPAFAKNKAEWDKSSLSFIDQDRISDGISATIENGNDSEEMQGEVNYEIYRSDKGNPKRGEVVETGVIPPLTSGEEVVLTYSPEQLEEGNYKFKAYQRTDHPGKGELWSETITVTEGTTTEDTTEDTSSEDTTEETQTEDTTNEGTTEETQTEDTTNEGATEETQTEDTTNEGTTEETQTEDTTNEDTTDNGDYYYSYY